MNGVNGACANEMIKYIVAGIFLDDLDECVRIRRCLQGGISVDFFEWLLSVIEMRVGSLLTCMLMNGGSRFKIVRH